MKKLLTITFIVLTILQSCKKNTIIPSNITGKWGWIMTSTGAAPGPLNPLTPQNSGITQSLIFNENNWVLTRNDRTVSSGTFTTSIAKNTVTGQNVNCIHYFRITNPVDSLEYYSVSNDTLIFSTYLIGALGSSLTRYIKK